MLVIPNDFLLTHQVGKLKHFFFRFKYLFPSKLPRGMSEFHTFCDSIFDVYDIPHTDPYYHSIAVMVQHLPPTTVYQSKAWFASSIYNAQAREVAFYKIQELQKKEKEKREAESIASSDVSLPEEKPMPH